ncbi:uncharacterized protein AB675_855 [Cyphellophora attinorum]|uniref:Uncharacterized protein n=1 Tax=Cyphellophora attinorum TaxID=1664694 RepID=A0A0N0NS71_9EURO|nr:uncharacterized protein AB675_855 [Phialophora attinorum]KPI45918.1 hypothetical protein AB675_855 [Phialophora attinorum]
MELGWIRGSDGLGHAEGHAIDAFITRNYDGSFDRRVEWSDTANKIRGGLSRGDFSVCEGFIDMPTV